MSGLMDKGVKRPLGMPLARRGFHTSVLWTHSLWSESDLAEDAGR